MRYIMGMTGISRTTLRKYLERYKQSKLGIQELCEMSDKQLDDLFMQVPDQKVNHRLRALEPLFPWMEAELKKAGVTLDLLWREYRKRYPDGYMISQFKRYFQAWQGRTKPSMHIEHKAGDKMYVDFTGEKLHFTNPVSGEITAVEVFVSILGASQLIYVEAVSSQKKEDFIAACRNALHYYGGSPEAIVPDNLRAAVDKTSKFEPQINRSFADFAHHYGMTVLPARAYRPKDKALVEGAVKIVYTRIFAVLRNHVFNSLETLNQSVWDALEELNSAPMKGRGYSRRKQFEEIESSELSRLPRIDYELRTELRATVMKNGHVALTCDKHYYSVPYTLIGYKVKIMYSHSRVDIYHQLQCVATHSRSRKAYGYTTDPQHLASTHKFVSQWSPEMFLEKALEIDMDVHLYIKRLFDLRQYPEQAFRSCIGILNFAKRYGNARLIGACRRALDFGTYSYGAICSILEKGLDTVSEDQQPPNSAAPDHENIRGQKYYDQTNGSESQDLPPGNDEPDDTVPLEPTPVEPEPRTPVTHSLQQTNHGGE